MKKLIIAGAAVIALAAGGFALTTGKKSETENTAVTAQAGAEESKSDKKQAAAGKKACELMTLGDAKDLLGQNATLLDGSGDPNLATTEKVTVDNCSYSADGATLGDMKQLTVQVHSGDTAAVRQAYDNYKKEYPGDALPEFGDSAYFGTETKQVHVLKNGTWFSVGGGSMNAGDAGNKELALKAARSAAAKL